MQSPLAFCKEFLNIKNKDGKIVPFEFNPLQKQRYLELMRTYWKPYKTESGHTWNRFSGVRYVDLKFRQWGESTMWCGLYFHDTVCNEGTDTVIYCQDAAFSVKMLEKYHLFWKKMPSHMQPALGRKSRGELTFPDIISSVSAGTPGSSEAVADKQGRSRTIRNCHLSEFSQWVNPRTTLNALQEAVPRDGNIFIEASPDQVGDFFHILYNKGKNPNYYWQSHFSPWYNFPSYALPLSDSDIKHILNTLTLEEQVLVKKHALTPGQIAWRREKIESKQGDMTLFWKEYPEDDEKCFEIAGNAVFEDKHRKINCQQREAIPGHIHTIGVDCAAGIEGGDYSAIEVIDTKTMENVFSWRGLVSLESLAGIVYEVWLKYPGLVGIESTGLGAAAVSGAYRIADWLWPSPGFLFSNNQSVGGWLTTGANKATMVYGLRYNIGEVARGNPGLLLGSEYVAAEMRWFQHLLKGGMGSPGTQNENGQKLTDDSLMALAIDNAMIDWVGQIEDQFYQRFPSIA